MADELIDILNQEGIPTGEIRLKSEAHQLGLYHASAHIWFYTKNKEILFQKRANNKDTFPGLWDVSVAGHIGAGESAENTAVRETKEEIGLVIKNEDLEFIGKYLGKKTPSPTIIDNEFHFIYLCQLKTTLDSLTLQKEEVSDVTLTPINEFKNLLVDPIKMKTYVPHDMEYFDMILKGITNRIQ